MFGRGATEGNFFLGTEAEFKNVTGEEKEEIAAINPDYVSDSGSRYWYTDNGVYRESDHWGKGVASCDWYLEGHGSLYADEFQHVHGREARIGFAEWSSFSPKGGEVALYDRSKGIFDQYQGMEKTTMEQITRGDVVINGETYTAEFVRELGEWTLAKD